MRRKYVLVGASMRGAVMYAKPMAEAFSHCAEAVGVFDVNPLRCEALKEYAGLDCPAFTDFDAMLAQTKPDAAIITTVDRYHHEYAIKCMRAGVDVIIEKPMAIDAEKCRALMDAEAETGRKITITFNARYAPYPSAVKQVIQDGLIGDVFSVDFEYLLDTVHGAEYFRRWHRRKENSGGLLVHKATHHFDLINWWISQEPVSISAFGTRRFYGDTSRKLGDRCLTCKGKAVCPIYVDIAADPLHKRFYIDCESADGYWRDKCAFDAEIDIEDTMSVSVAYNGGAVLSYSLIAHSPYEGYKVVINGSKGRLEAAEYHSGIRISEPAFSYTVYDRQGKVVTTEVPKAAGAHGGGDERLLRVLFEGVEDDPLGHQAGSLAGAVSIMTGICANESIRTGKLIHVNDLVDLDPYRRVAGTNTWEGAAPSAPGRRKTETARD